MPPPPKTVALHTSTRYRRGCPYPSGHKRVEWVTKRGEGLHGPRPRPAAFTQGPRSYKRRCRAHAREGPSVDPHRHVFRRAPPLHNVRRPSTGPCTALRGRAHTATQGPHSTRPDTARRCPMSRGRLRTSANGAQRPRIARGLHKGNTGACVFVSASPTTQTRSATSPGSGPGRGAGGHPRLRPCAPPTGTTAPWALTPSCP